MAANMRAAPFTHLAVPQPTMPDFLRRHGLALLRLSVHVARMYIEIRVRLGGVRNADDVWTAVEELRPSANRISRRAYDDVWDQRARDLPKPSTPSRVPQPAREAAVDLLDIKYEYFFDLFLSSPHALRGRRREDWRQRADVPPFLRRIGGYAELMPTLLLALRLDAIFPVLPEAARSLIHRAADDALDQLISLALAIDGKVEPPSAITLPEPMPILKLFGDWERVRRLRQASDVAT